MNGTQKAYVLRWSPTAEVIGHVFAIAPTPAKRLAPTKYRKYLGEIIAEELPAQDERGRTQYLKRSHTPKGPQWVLAVCRIDEQNETEDPIMDASGCYDDFAQAWKAQDRRDGCPKCIEEVLSL